MVVSIFFWQAFVVLIVEQMYLKTVLLHSNQKHKHCDLNEIVGCFKNNFRVRTIQSKLGLETSSMVLYFCIVSSIVLQCFLQS